MADLLPLLPWVPLLGEAEVSSAQSSPTPPAKQFQRNHGGKRAQDEALAGWEVLPLPTIQVTPSSEGETPPCTPLPRRPRRSRSSDRDESTVDSTAPHSARSTPSSSPSLRKRLLLLPPNRSPPAEQDTGTMVEKGSEKGSDSSSEKGGGASTPGTQSLGSRNFIRNSKKMQSWYSMLSPTYKQRNEDFRKLFSKLPEAERLIVDYSCALQRDILLQGRLYLSENWICFYSNIFRWETTVRPGTSGGRGGWAGEGCGWGDMHTRRAHLLPCLFQISIQLKEVTCLKKEKTAKLIPNAIQICTENEKHFFTSFGARDRCFLLIFRLWQNALLDKVPGAGWGGSEERPGRGWTKRSPSWRTWGRVRTIFSEQDGKGLHWEEGIRVSDHQERQLGQVGKMFFHPLRRGERRRLSYLWWGGGRKFSHPPLFALVHPQTLSPRELWHLVHQCYGSELGLTSEDEDYVCPLQQLNGLGGHKEVGDVIALSDMTLPRRSPDLSREPSPTASRRTQLTPCPSQASSDGDNVGEEDKERQTDSQPDASSSQTVTPVTEPPPAEMPPDGPAPLAPLDLLPSEEMLSDTSNSSSSATEEADLTSFLPDLSGRLLINCVFHMGADRLQQMLFSDSPFLQGFLQQRKFTDVTFTPWSGESKCHQSRVLSYTIPISNPLGPKSAAVVETQTLFRRSPQGGGCVVDSEVLTQGIPYQDYFYTAHRYCILSLARNKTRLRVSSEIRYRKQPWSLVKSLIEKNSWSGIEDYFHHLERELSKAEKLSLEEGGKEARGLLSGLRRRKRPLSWRSHGENPPHADPDACTRGGLHPSGSITSRLSEPSLDQNPGSGIPGILLIISIVLVILVALNALLFYRLWSLERTAHTFEAWHSLALGKEKFPQTAAEWAEILALQKQFHSVEVHKWRQILRASVELLDEMKFSLEKLHQGIEMSEPPFDPEPLGENAFS
ncbi:protein Aster-A isoform X2 [Macrotis lagotis]|uniref:protein Aster-A isoform X2 n=1 Tax=Macrotis lagotis TaxID=92651 RepID=UPI003D68634F